MPPPEPAAPTAAGHLPLMHLLPHHLLGRLAHWITRCEWPPVKDWLIRKAVARFHVDMTQAALEPDPAAYASFNAFFTRELRPGARPVWRLPRSHLLPGRTEKSARSAAFPTGAGAGEGLGLLAASTCWAATRSSPPSFADGSYATIYLSPRDYHRVHMPLAGTLRRMVHVPGRLFSVNQTDDRGPAETLRTQRARVSVFDTGQGPMAVILVGAFFVGSMDTVWAGTVAPAHRRATVWDYAGRAGGPARARGRAGPVQHGIDRDRPARLRSGAVGRVRRARDAGADGRGAGHAGRLTASGAGR